MQTKFSKKSVAREVLIFFSSILFIVIIYVFLIARNNYYSYRGESASRKVEMTDKKLNGLPRDYNGNLYTEIKDKFYDKYIDGQDTILVLHNKEAVFKEQHFSAKYVIPTKKGFEYFPAGRAAFFSEKTSFGNDFDKQAVRVTDPEIIKQLNEAASNGDLVFYMMYFSEFLEHLKDLDYLNALRKIATISPDNIKEGFLYYDASIVESRRSLVAERKENAEHSSYYLSSELTSDTIFDLLFTWFIGIVVCVYVLRPCAYLVIWALRNIKAIEEQ